MLHVFLQSTVKPLLFVCFYVSIVLQNGNSEYPEIKFEVELSQTFFCVTSLLVVHRVFWSQTGRNLPEPTTLK